MTLLPKPRVLILHANGTNRDVDLAQGFMLAGADTSIKTLYELTCEPFNFESYQLIALAGGFSYADTLGAGKLWAIELKHHFEKQLGDFIATGKPVIGICNGFQTLVKAGFLPNTGSQNQEATLTFNKNGHFECRWVTLVASSSTCLWTRNLKEPIYCPVAHKEGQLVMNSIDDVHSLESHQQIALRYAFEDGTPAQGVYPFNPNGSINDVAGICNQAGNVLGMMPHPENHIFDYQHPRWTRGEKGQLGLALLQLGVEYARRYT